MVIQSAAFQEAVGAAVRECYDLGYRPTYFQQMLSELDAVGAAQKLLTTSTVSDGFTRLWEMKRLDLTVEAIALRPEFGELFTRSELRTAKDRLADYGYSA